jgi:multidrug resistance efflux pump
MGFGSTMPQTEYERLRAPMAERKINKSRPTPARAPASAAPRSVSSASNPLQVAVERLEARVHDLKRERDAFEAELAAAKAKITALELARTDAINRIDWVLDSLHTVLQDKS